MDILASFQQANARLDVVVGETPEMVLKSALLGIRDGAVRNSIAPRPEGWSKLLVLVQTAASSQTAGDEWTVIGEVSEVRTDDISHLVISAGAGIRFVLNSPKGATLTYVLPRDDIPRLQEALAKAGEMIFAP